MAYPFLTTSSGYTAAWPAAVVDPPVLRGLDDEGVEVTGEEFLAPASADGEGRYRKVLDLVPLEQSGVVVEVDSSPRVVIPYGDAPAVGEVAVSMETGTIEFNAADAGLGVEASYRGRGTAWNVHLAAMALLEARAMAVSLAPMLGGPGTAPSAEFVDVSASGFVELAVVGSAPSAPTAGARLYVVDNAGSLELHALFPTGASQLVAAEP